MDTKETIIETRQGTIKIVKYNKPSRKNAIDVNMYLRVTKILNEAAEDVDISVMVLTGAGDYYSSGNDLIAAMESSRDATLLNALKDFIHAFITFPKLLIAIVNGPAIGIAATTLALCDLVFAAETVSKFFLQQSNSKKSFHLQTFTVNLVSVFLLHTVHKVRTCS